VSHVLLQSLTDRRGLLAHLPTFFLEICKAFDTSKPNIGRSTEEEEFKSDQ
jgi:hypothetical protein